MFHDSHHKPVLTSFVTCCLYVINKMVCNVFPVSSNRFVLFLKYMKNISRIARDTAE